MEHGGVGQNQDVSSMGLLSPLSSVDLTSRDRAVVTEELEKKLKIRAERQDLVQRNILPDFAHPIAPKLMSQSRELQRGKLVDNLTKKLRNRSDPNHLVSLNILPDQPNVDPSLQSKMRVLKRSKLADTLNDKIANRPGPLVLVRDRILAPNLGEMVRELNTQSSDALPTSEAGTVGVRGIPAESLGGALPPEIAIADGMGGFQRGGLTHRHSYAGGLPSPGQIQMDMSPAGEQPSPLNSDLSGSRMGRKMSDSSISPAPSPGDEEARSPVKSPQDQSPRSLNSGHLPLGGSVLPRAIHTPGIMSSSVGKAPSPSQNRKKAQKQQKYRKLRYHEYVPPTKNNGKGGKTTPKPLPKSDSPYALLLQQQQLFLQLHVLREQYPSQVIKQKLPDLLNSLSQDCKGQTIVSKGRVPVTSPASDGSRGGAMITSVPQVIQVEHPNKHNLSTVRFDDLKVSDLKSACKEMGMIVSGKKAELVERLLDHNKGLLPAIALPDNSAKDSKRHSFSHTSSVDSQPPSTVSPGSPSSPVFQFPADKQGRGGSQVSNMNKQSKVPPMLGHHSESMPAMTLPEVLPGANFQQEFDELMQKQKRDYFTQNFGSKPLAPRPDINDLVAIRVPPAYSPAQQQTASSAGNTATLQATPTTSSRGKVSTLPHHMDPKQMMMFGDKSSRSLPASPQPHSPDNLFELMDNNDNSLMTSSGVVPSSSAAAVVDNSAHQVNKSVSLPSNQSEQQQQQDISNFLMESVSGFLPLEEVAPPHTTTSTIGMSSSMAYQSPNQPQPPQQQQPTKQQQQQRMMRPVRSSVPVHPVLPKVYPMNPPSYSSHQMMQRSQSVSGPIPGVAASHLPQMHQQSGGGYSSELSDMVGNEIGNHADIMDIPMDTGDGGFHDIMDNLMFRPDATDYGQPSSLPATHSHLPPPPPPHSYGTPTKYGNRSELVQSDNFAMPFGNPHFGLTAKTPSDMCLNMDNHRNSTGGVVVPGNGSVMLGEDLNWLDLDNHQTLSFSPTIGSGFPSNNLSRHSNPGSLQHDQFHMNFLDDPQVPPTSSSAAMMTSSNPALNGFVDVPTSAGFLDSTGVPHQAGLFPELLSS